MPKTILLAFTIATGFLFSVANCRSRQLDRITFASGERERLVLLHVPKIVQDGQLGRVPLFLVLHGGGGTARGAVRMTRSRFNRMADKTGFVVAYPEGIDRSWNDGRRSDHSTAARENIDDVGFLRETIARLVRDYSVDPARVFATGMSNGGFMSLRLACELAGTVRAVAPVTAQLSEDLARTCRPRVPVDLLIINGTDDPIVPYAGGEVSLFKKKRGRVLSTDATITRFRMFNRCHGDGRTRPIPDRDQNDATRAFRVDYDCPTPGRVRLIRVQGGGHTWPGGRAFFPERTVGRLSRDLDASGAIHDFFLNLDGPRE